MIYRQLAGIEVSVLAVGAASFGGIGSARRLIGRGDSEAEARALLDRAVELGLDLIDTAGSYGDGASEQIIGGWLRARGPALRHRIRLSSKVGLRGGLARGRVIDEVDRSLARLGVDTLDLYLAHVPDPAIRWDDVARSFELLIERGKVRRAGVSNVSAADLAALSGACGGGCGGFRFVQNQLNLLHRDDDVLAACARLGLDYAAYSPLAGGLLGGAYALDGAIPDGSRIGLRRDLYAAAWTPASAARLARLTAAAAARAVSPAALATWWLIHHPGVSSIMTGARRPEQLAGVVDQALALPWSEPLWRGLGEVAAAGAARRGAGA